MSIAILYDVQQEVRRLFIAGSGMAAGDMSLKKLLPQLQKLGEAAPVFKRIGQAVQEVLEAGREQGTAKLLELGTLLNSVLYTQGKTEPTGELAAIVGTTMRLNTSVPYRKLGPVITALSEKGQGRMEVLRQADEEGLFRDFRVVPLAVAAMDDAYAEVAEFMQQKVIPSLGIEVLPALLRQLDLQGGKGHGRRLQLIHQLQGEEGLELYLQAAAEGSVEVKAAAVELLGEYPEQETLVLEMADDKRKEVRRAAYHALSKLGTDKAQDRLYQVLDSKDRELAIEPIRNLRSELLDLRVIRHANNTLERFLAGTKPEECIEQLLTDLRSLHDKRSIGVYQLLEKLLSTSGFMAKETGAVQEEAAQMLLNLDMPEAYQYLIELQHAYSGRFITYSFRAAVQTLSPEEVYDRFSPDLKNRRSSIAKDLTYTFHRMVPSISRQLYASEEGDQTRSAEPVWDRRWVRLFKALDDEELVCGLVESTDQEVVPYLVNKLKQKQKPNFQSSSTVDMLLALFKLKYPQIPELIMELLETRNSRQMYYLYGAQSKLLSMLPASYADRLRSFADTVAYESVKEQLREIADSLQHNDISEEKGTGIWDWIKNKMS
jgi:hypothetical protein